MWVLSGPFDGNEGDINFEKRKLLKPGKQYVLGRKDRELVVNNKKVSREHATFIIGEYSPDDMSAPSTRPSVRLHNPRNLPLIFARNGEPLQIGASSTAELQDGDVVRPFTNASIELTWHPLYCYSTEVTADMLDGCASLGMTLVQTFHSDVTHHVTSALSLTPSIALSLLSGCKFVTPKWVAQVLRIGQGNGVAPLEVEFELPQTSKFQPQFSPSLPSSLKLSRLWKPSEERREVFSGHHFVLLTYRAEEIEPLQDIFSHAGGSSTIFYVDAGRSKFSRILSKNKVERSFILVTDEVVKQAVEVDQWNGLQDEAQKFGRQFIRRERVLEAVIMANSSHLSAEAVGEQVDSVSSPSLLQDPASNALPEEPSNPVETISKTKPLVKRAAPSASPATPLEEEESPPPPPPPSRRPLTRRAGTAMKASYFSIDDSTTLETDSSVPVDDESMPPPPPPPTQTVLGVDFDAPAVPRSSRLKRRAGTAGLNSLTQAPDRPDPVGVGVEPPLKKFKALFEESDPDRMSQAAPNTYMETDAHLSPAGPQSLPPDETHRGPASSGLDIIEEEEESGMSVQTGFNPRGVKRKPDRQEDGGADEMASEGGRTVKRRVVDSPAGQPSQPPRSSSVVPIAPIPQTQSHKAPDSGFKQPDVDNKFLKAIASMKKGKKNEDSFDREFNNLRISKPDLKDDDREKEWSVLADFGDERNIRGNFMVVVEMEVFRRENDNSRVRRGTGRAEWEGKSDFKKFRKKHLLEQRPVVELTVSEENDYGMGSAYWRGNSPSRSQPLDESSGTSNQLKPAKSRQIGGKYKGPTVPMEDSDQEDENKFPKQPSVKRVTQSQKGSRSKGRSTRPKEETFEPLFLGSDDNMADEGGNEDEDEEVDQLDEDTLTLPSTRSSKTQKSQRTARQRRDAPAAVIIDDDSDDGTTFKGFGMKASGRPPRRRQ